MRLDTGDTAQINGVDGKIVRTYQQRPGNKGGTRGEVRNVWWQQEGTTREVLFSLRRDGRWRAVEGPANGPELVRILERTKRKYVRNATREQ